MFLSNLYDSFTEYWAKRHHCVAEITRTCPQRDWK